jgi:hypothetical protein
VWKAVENLAPTGIRFPDSRARSESLYRPSYCGSHTLFTVFFLFYESEFRYTIFSSGCSVHIKWCVDSVAPLVVRPRFFTP